MRILNEVVGRASVSEAAAMARRRGVAKTFEVRLPEVGSEPFLVVIHWRRPQSETAVGVAGQSGRAAGEADRSMVRPGVRPAVGCRGRHPWHQATVHAVEGFLVRTWIAIRRLLWLVSWAFWWLNLWGEERFERLREALLLHPWRIAKTAVYLFNWIGRMLRELLHPHPKLTELTG